VNWNKVGCLTDGRIGNNVVGLNTLKFVSVSALPSGPQTNLLPSCRRLSTDPYRLRYTAGGDRIEYPGTTTTPPGAEMTSVKLHFASVVSTPNARIMCTEVNDSLGPTPQTQAGGPSTSTVSHFPSDTRLFTFILRPSNILN
jgi:hypothetical protein